MSADSVPLVRTAVVRTKLNRLAAFAAVLALFIWAAVVWIAFGRTIIRFYSPLPYWDYWNTVGHYESYRHFDLRILWEQHNEHRIVFPELIFAADYLLFRGLEILPLVLSAVLYLGTWLTLSATLYRTRLPVFVRLCAILLAGVVMGWQGGALLIANPFLIQWSLMLAAAACALFLLARVPGSRRPWMYLAAAIGCSAICTYSSANGLFLWPVILIAAFLLRLSKAQVLVLAASVVVLVGLYFAGYRFSHGSNPGALLTSPSYAIRFVAAYLGMPFTTIRPAIGISAGFFVIGAYAVFVFLAAQRRLLNTAPGIVLLGLYLLCILTAVITAVGRMNPHDDNFIAATAQRYIVVPLVGHAALILAGAWLLGNSRQYLWAPFLSIMALGFAFTARSPRLQFWLDFSKSLLSDCQLASLGFESGVDDPALMKAVFAGPEYVKLTLPVLRRNHLSTFANNRMNWLGRSASAVFHSVSDRPEPGAITAVYPLESGLMVLGWTDSPRRIWHPQEFVFLDNRKQIVGFGRKLPAGLPRGMASLETPQSIAWVGFVNLSFGDNFFRPYAIEAHGKALAPVGETIAVPPARVLPASQVGITIAPLQWKAKGSWIENGPLPGTPTGMPPSISYWESWAGGDGNTGSLASAPFAAPAGNCIVLSGAHGPAIEGLSERLIDAETQQTIATAPLVGRDLLWRFWRIDLPATTRLLKIITEDQGHDWGEWMAIGEPSLCK